MIKNYLKIAFRSLVKNKIFSFVNIGGLAVGMAVAMLIGLWIHDEFSFNKYHRNYDRIGQVFQRGQSEIIPNQSMPLAAALNSSFSDDFKYVVMSSGTQNHIVSEGGKKITQGGRFMQPSAPDMLTLDMIYGTKEGLKDMNSILLTRSLAKKLFGDVDPVGELLKIDDKLSVKVTGVYEDLPVNDEFRDMAYIMPWDLNVAVNNDWFRTYANDWNSNTWFIYAQLTPNADFDKVSAKMKDIARPAANGGNPEVFIHPMSKWHLYSQFENGKAVMSEPLKFCWFYGIIGIFVLLLACINFMNLSTARSEKRAREVGIRKAMGSLRWQLIGQFFSESLLVAIFAFILSIALVELTLPWFNAIAGKSIIIPWTSGSFWMAGLVFCLFTGLLAGSYPALYLSSFKPVKVLKGLFRAGRLAALPRKVLVVVQFTVSIALIIGTIIVYQQIRFAKNRPVGYSRDGLLALEMVSPEFQGKYDLIRNELKNTGAVDEVAESDGELMEVGSTQGIQAFDWKGKPSGLNGDMAYITITPGYGRTIGWQFLDGNDLSGGSSVDSSEIIINEAAAQKMELRDPVGETITWKNTQIGGRYKIRGVVKNIVMNSPYEAAQPTIFLLKGDLNWILIKINPAISAGAGLSKIGAVFKKLLPAVPFDYKFVDDAYAAKFAAEERVGKLASFFAVLAVFISCLGLFGLASFVAEQRTREIGVRKVLGASTINLWGLLSKDFIGLVVLSNLIAGPLAWLVLHQWLKQYEYRTPIHWWVFGLSGLGALLITLITVSYQALKAALMNPVKSLKNE
ncbi:MAG: ABC transporter permease [Puia sp.]|nr:ABC transporter permease [Puia sp.]